MARHKKTWEKIEAAREVLEEDHPMTLRQVYYRLVSMQLLANTQSQYASLGRALVDARKDGLIPWEWIEDRLRVPHYVSMWDDLADFADTAVEAYRRDVWAAQPVVVECWLEKDALSGIFDSVLRQYGLTLNVGRGYDSWTSICEAATRYSRDSKPKKILYFGDFDPSGQDMIRSLEARLAFFEAKTRNQAVCSIA